MAAYCRAGTRRLRAGLIASDPHLATTLPPLWLVAGLHAPGLDVVGLMLPGLPLVVLGRNTWMAWDGTSQHAASSELVGISAELMTERQEVVPVRDRAPATLRMRDKRFGPVVSDGILLRSDGHWRCAGSGVGRVTR